MSTSLVIEHAMQRIGVLLATIPGYTVQRSPIHLIDDKSLPAIVYNIESIAQQTDLEFFIVDWECTLSVDVIIKTRVDNEKTLVVAHGLVHDALYSDRHLSMNVYLYNQGDIAFTHSDESNQTISRLSSSWTVEYRTVQRDLKN